PHFDAALALLSVALSLLFVAMLVVFYFHPGLAPDNSFPWITSLSTHLLIALACNGTLSGILLAFHGGMRPIAEEFAQNGRANPAVRSPVSLLTLLTIFAVVWFY